MRCVSWVLIGVLCCGAAGAQEEEPEHELVQLQRIRRLMDEVESRLCDADTGAFTQGEQRQILEALRTEDKTLAALEKLIHDIENRPP